MYIAKCLALHASGTLTCTNTRAITNDIITTIAVQYSTVDCYDVNDDNHIHYNNVPS